MKIKNFALPHSAKLVAVVVASLLLVASSLCTKAFSQFEARKSPRILAPGVMKTVNPSIEFDETFDDKEIVELTSLGKEYDWAKLRFPTKNHAADNPTTCLEFQFKVPRLIEVDIPTMDGKIEKTPVWYVIYCVTNKKWAVEEAKKITDLQVDLMTADDLAPLETDIEFGSTLFVNEVEPGRYNVNPGESTITFTPQFLFASDSLAFPKTKQYVVQEQLIPLAIPAIIRQEDPNRTFETTVSMSDREIKPGETVWGIAMWKDIDPNVKDFSVYVSGLSNAYHWDASAYEPGTIGTGYVMTRKTLKLNFWAPGAADHLMNKDIQYGQKLEVVKRARDAVVEQSIRRYNPQTKTFEVITSNGGEEPPVDFEWVYR